MLAVKELQDIYIIDGEIELKRNLKVTSFQVEKDIENYSYKGQGLEKDPEIENAELPPFISSFYFLVLSSLKIPSPETYVEKYLQLNKIELKNNYFEYKRRGYSFSGLRARMLRAYPSLVRDFHFYLLLNENPKFSNVEYSLSRDYYDGLDLKVIYKNYPFYLSLFVGTKRGKNFKEKKSFRHDYTRHSEIQLKLNLKELKKIGDYYLLGRRQIDYLIEEIKKRLNN